MNIKEDPEGGNSEWFMHEFQDKGSIIFTSLDEYNKIVNFVYADNKEGYFDLEKNEVIFESDNVKKN